jgi:hypothetical protein
LPALVLSFETGVKVLNACYRRYIKFEFFSNLSLSKAAHDKYNSVYGLKQQNDALRLKDLEI